MKQQTAVEWLLRQQFELMMVSDKLSQRKFLSRRFKIEEQAKQMEKEQIERAYIKGGVIKFDKDIEAEQYYNETYKIN